MKLVKTKDDSYTFYNEEYDEHYHSLSGALEEANKKYIEPLEVKNGMVILDVCFGLGYNTYAALKAAKHLKIIGLEKDTKILEGLQQIKMDKEFEIIKKVSKDLEYKDENYEIRLLVGDATKTIKEVKEKVDVVFFDPFSPKRNPECWTAKFFKDVFNVMKPGAKLATYSCARVVRDNMKKAGFEIKDSIKLYRRGPSTIGTKN